MPGLGTFRPTVESSGASSVDDYDVNTDVKGIHIRFIPVNDKGEELTSRKFAESLTFSYQGLRKTQKKETATHKVRYAGSVEVAATQQKLKAYPIFLKIDGEATGDIKTTGSTFTLSGGKVGTSYQLKRGADLEHATAISAATQKLSDGQWTISTTSQSADATAQNVWATWGEGHSVLLGSFKIVSE